MFKQKDCADEYCGDYSKIIARRVICNKCWGQAINRYMDLKRQINWLQDEVSFYRYIHLFDFDDNERSKKDYYKFIAKDYEHDGDCTGKCHSCLACQKEYILKGGE